MNLTLLEEEVLWEINWETAHFCLAAFRDAAELLFAESPDCIKQWKQVMLCFSKWWDGPQSPNATAGEILSPMNCCMIPVQDRNKYIDYKKYDLDVLKAIPFLLPANSSQDFPFYE